MKICRNELLLLGGMYQLIAVTLALFNTEIAYITSGILYILFWIAVLSLSLAFVSSWGFVYKMNNMMPKLSVFLASIGWIPYFTIIYALLSVTIDYIVTGSDSLTVFLNNYMPVYQVYQAAIILSLLYAAYKVFYKKEDLSMSCYNYHQQA